MKLSPKFRTTIPLLLVTLLVFSILNIWAEKPKIKVLLIDGQNNHDWQATTPVLKKILEDSGLFHVDVTTTPPAKAKAPKLPNNPTPEQKTEYEQLLHKFNEEEKARKQSAPAAWAQWKPSFSNYSVVLSNYNGEKWPIQVSEAFSKFVIDGGGFVCVHAASNAFRGWKEYNQMIGLGGWGGRSESSGPYLELKEGQWVPDPSPGICGKHGPREEFLIKSFLPNHPIMKGLPAEWMHTQDEVYAFLRGPAQNLSVLAYAISTLDQRPKPMLMTIDYGKGRVFHTTLGHDTVAMSGLGFQVTLCRGTEWAATGAVTIPAPKPDRFTTESPAAIKSIK